MGVIGIDITGELELMGGDNGRDAACVDSAARTDDDTGAAFSSDRVRSKSCRHRSTSTAKSAIDILLTSADCDGVKGSIITSN
jgi:hypothetical protein